MGIVSGSPHPPNTFAAIGCWGRCPRWRVPARESPNHRGGRVGPISHRGKIGGRVQWYPFFEGDYLRDTYHLTWDQDLAYRRLLDLCYRNGGSVPMNRALLYQKIRVDPNNAEQVAAVEFVLKSYFKGKGKSYQNQRVLKELSKADQLHDARVRGGKERAKRSAELKLSSSPAVVSTSTSTTTKDKTPLPPVSTGGLTHKVLPGGSSNGLQYIERYGQLVEVTMGRRRRLPNLENTAGMTADYLVQWFEHRGFVARILDKESI